MNTALREATRNLVEKYINLGRGDLALGVLHYEDSFYKIPDLLKAPEECTTKYLLNLWLKGVTV